MPTTPTDVTAPDFVQGFPTAGAAQPRTLTVEVQLNEAGTAYVAAVPVEVGTGVAPPLADLKAETVANAFFGTAVIAAPLTTTLVSVTGLLPSSAYDVYVGAEDNASPPFPAAQVVRLDLTTSADTEAPEFATGFPVPTSITDRGVVIQVRTNERGVAFVAVAPSDTPVGPTSAQLVAQSYPAATVLTSAPVASAGATTSIVVSGLTPSTDYTAWVVAGDDVSPSPNVQPEPATATFTTLDDITDPSYIAGYPKVDEQTMTTAKIVARTDEPGQFYYLVVGRDALAIQPTVSQVVSGTGPWPVSVVWAKGSTVIPTADVEASALIEELTHTTPYDAYVVLQDSATPVPNRLDTVSKLQFSTAVDTLPPVFETGYPDVFSISDTQFSMGFQLDEPCTVFYVVLVDPQSGVAPTPNAADMLLPETHFPNNEHGSVDVAGGGSTVVVTVSNLVLSTSYSVFVIAQDKATPARNRQAQPVRLAVFTVQDVTPPQFTQLPAVSDVRDKSVSLSVIMNERGVFVFVVVPRNTTAPTAAQVRSGSNYGDAVAHGSGEVELPMTAFSAPSSATLTQEREYDVYVPLCVCGVCGVAVAVCCHGQCNLQDVFVRACAW